MSDEYDDQVEIPEAFPPEDEIDRREKQTPACSPYIAHAIIEESLLHAWTMHPLLGGVRKPATGTMLRGSILHALLFEGGKGIAVYDGDSFRSNDAKAFKAAALERGEYPCVAAKMTEYAEIAVRIEVEINRQGYDLKDGFAEEKLSWYERSFDGTTRVLCHGRPDWRSKDCRLWLDLKTGAGSVHPDACGKKLATTVGVIQHAAYTSALSKLNPDVEGRVEGVFLFAETAPPFCVTAGIPNGEMRALGIMRWARAIELWSKALATDTWPAHSPTPGPVMLAPPGWLMAQEEAREYDSQ